LRRELILAEPVAPEPSKLIKDEFEKTSDFNERVRNEKARFDAAMVRYTEKVRRYNDAIETFSSEARDLLMERIKAKRTELLAQALGTVLGAPILLDLKYDADTETFFGRIWSDLAAFDERVAIDAGNLFPRSVCRDSRTESPSEQTI